MTRTHWIVLCALGTCVSGFAQHVDLERGKTEVRLFAGSTAGQATLNTPAIAGGGEVAYGLSRFFAWTGHYAYDSLGSLADSSCFGSTCIQSSARLSAHEFMSGVRFSAPNRSRVTPYASMSIGAIRFGAEASVSGGGFSNSMSETMTKFAIAPGGGLNFRISRRFGANVDVRWVRPLPNEDTPWYIRPSAGLYFRF